MNLSLQTMSAEHYPSVLALWQQAPGVGLSAADSEAGIAHFLERNPGLSFVALVDETPVGAVLCGHDGRRGYIHHLAVRPDYQRQGIGQALVEQCLAALRQQGIDKCHLFVFEENQTATTFWQKIGWLQRDELVIFSRYTEPPEC